MGSMEVKLLGTWASPYVARARIALNIKSVEYEFQEEILLSKSETLLNYNPIYRKVPVLIHGDRPICESLIIIQYIDDVWASGQSIILPSDPYDRAMARFWTAYIDDKLFLALKQIEGAEDDEVKKAAAVAEATQILVLLDDVFTKCSKGKKFFGGENIGCLDITLGSFSTWFSLIHKMCNVNLIDESKTPNLFKWVQEFSADDAVKNVMPETEKLMELMAAASGDPAAVAGLHPPAKTSINTSPLSKLNNISHHKNLQSSNFKKVEKPLYFREALRIEMASMEVKLLGAWASPYVARARIALNVKNVDYEFQEEEVLLSKSETLLKYNPIYKKIPVLLHGDRAICESLIIIQYIDDVWATGQSILPSDPYDRAMARFWTAYIDDKLFPALKQIVGAEDDEVKKAAAVAEANQVLVLLDDAFTKCSKGEKFFGGENIGCLDITLGCFSTWFRVIHKMCNVNLIDESKTPNLFKWDQECRADDAVNNVMPETEKLMEFAKFFLRMMKAAASAGSN